jgi:hypothetical protein
MMPRGAKFVIGWLIFLAALNFTGLFLHSTLPVANMVALVIQIALLTGLSARQAVAWYVARWLAGLAIVIQIIVLVLVLMASNRSGLMITTALIGLALVSGLFYLLGRHDSKSYFTRRSDLTSR